MARFVDGSGRVCQRLQPGLRPGQSAVHECRLSCRSWAYARAYAQERRNKLSTEWRLSTTRLQLSTLLVSNVDNCPPNVLRGGHWDLGAANQTSSEGFEKEPRRIAMWSSHGIEAGNRPTCASVFRKCVSQRVRPEFERASLARAAAPRKSCGTKAAERQKWKTSSRSQAPSGPMSRHPPRSV